MYQNLVLSIALAFVFSVSSATPIELGHDLIPRNNNYHLNCSNAPGVVAG